MGPTWTKEEAHGHQKTCWDSKARKFHGPEMKWMVRYEPGDKRWAEMKSCAISIENGEPSMFTFTAFDNLKWTLSRADMINRCISLCGVKDYKVGDEIITYWIDDRRLCYHGRIIQIDAGMRVLEAKMHDGNQSWLPFDFVHKL